MNFVVISVFISLISIQVGKFSDDSRTFVKSDDVISALSQYASLHSFENLLVNSEPFEANLGESLRTPASQSSLLSQPERCSPKSGRLYFEDLLKLMKKRNSSLIDTRTQVGTDIPRECVVYAQRSRNRLAETKPSKSYANCMDENSEPSRNVKKPCVTENYANLIHNAYTEVMNCFGLDQKLYFPQIVFESAFHLNAIAHNNYDSGIGQYTQNGIRHIIDNPLTKKIFYNLFQSGKASCNTLAKYIRQDLTAQNAKVKSRCSFIMPPANPVQSFVFFAVHHLRDEVLLEAEMEEHGVFEKLIELGWTDNFTDPENLEKKRKLIKSLSILSYNAGVGKTMNMLRNYLKNRAIVSESENWPLSDTDFDFTNDTTTIRNALKKVNKNKFRQFFENKKIKRLSFPEYVIIFHSGYMHEINQITLEFETKLGSGCTSSVELKF